MHSFSLSFHPNQGADNAATRRWLPHRAAVVLWAAVGFALAGVPLPAFAQAVAAADPLDPKASVPPAAYRSAFGTYRPAKDTPVGSWREANDTVNRIGGWRAYASEAQQPGAAASAPVPPAPPTSARLGPSGPAGHKTH